MVEIDAPGARDSAEFGLVVSRVLSAWVSVFGGRFRDRDLRDGASDAAPQATPVLGVAFDPVLSELVGFGPRPGVR